MRRFIALACALVLCGFTYTAAQVSMGGSSMGSGILSNSGVVGLISGTAGSPPLYFNNETGKGLYDAGNGILGFSTLGAERARLDSSGLFTLGSSGQVRWTSGASSGSADTQLQRNAAGVFGATLFGTDGTDVTLVEHGDIVRQRSEYTLTPASGGAGNCGTSFAAAALTADCTVFTLSAGEKLVSVYADVTAGFTCSGTCTGTKVFQCGTAAGGTQVFAAGLNVAATGQFGLADADLGSGMTRAAAIQGGLIGSWSTTTPISCRFTSGTGNWGNGSTTNVNAGSIKFFIFTEQAK